MMKSYSDIRKHRRLYHVGRWISRHPAWLHRVLRMIDRRTKPLQKLFLWLGHWLKFLQILNPLRYITKLDWYIIRKFIGTYFLLPSQLSTTSMRTWQSSHNIMLRLKQLSSIIISTLPHILLIFLAPFLFLFPLFTLRQSSQAILSSSLCWQRVSVLSGY